MRIAIGGRRPQEVLEGKTRDAGAWLQVDYTHKERDGEFQLQIITIYQDGLPIVGPEVTVSVKEDSSSGSISIPMGPNAGEPWATGSYVTYIYEGGRKVGQANWSI